MEKLPILNIDQFRTSNTNGSFYANTFSEHLKNNHKTISVPHKHDFYLAVLFISGTGVHEIDFESHTIKPGSVFLLKPGQTHHWEFTSDPTGYIFFHNTDFYESNYTNRTLLNFPFFYSNQNHQSFYFKGDGLNQIEQYFKKILVCHTSDNLMKQQQLCSLVDLVYIELLQHNVSVDVFNTISSKTYIDKIYAFEQLVEFHYKTEKSPKAYASMMNISPKHLNRVCSETLGKTTTDLITERIILEAKRLLIYSKNNFSEIAWSLGYEDYAYFSRLFKLKTGYTPSEFQKQQLEH